MNYSDSERISACLEKNSLKTASNIDDANLAVFNTCGVRQMAEDRVYGQIHNLKKNNPSIKIILTGCLSNRKDVQRRLKNKVDLFTEIKNFPSEINKIIRSSKKESRQYLKINPNYNSRFQAYVPIMTGCNNFCAYCIVPHARGREVSRSAKEIISEIRHLADEGYKEITLLGQNVNSYKDGKINFSRLLKKVNAVPGKFWIFFISNHPKDVTDEMIETVTRCKKVCEHFHLPIQAASDEIIRKMNRKYTSKHYLRLVKKIKLSFKKYKPNIPFAITSDIIVGFPGETKKQFLKSAAVMKKVEYDMVYFGQYSPRPGTAAWKMKDNVSKKEKARRENFLNEILKKTNFANNKKYVGRVLEVLIEKEKKGYYYGKTRTLKNVKIPATRKNLVGNFANVTITKANAWNLAGELNINEKEKVVVILGPTASGKSDMAIKLARKFDGEIISADSRQIYRGMDIGSGKVTKTEQTMAKHHMLDIISPNTEYNAAKFKKQAEKIIKDILKRGKFPIICGGTGFWIKALVDDIVFPEVKPDWKLRKKLNEKSVTELVKELKKLDAKRAKEIDIKNKVRLIRAIEIAKSLGKVPKIETRENKYEFLQIGIKFPKEILHRRIKSRLDKRFKQGMVKEVENLHFNPPAGGKVSWKRLEDFGLEYRWIAKYLQNNISLPEMKGKLYQETRNYAKRQMTWFKKDTGIKWIKNYKDIEKETKNFLK